MIIMKCRMDLKPETMAKFIRALRLLRHVIADNYQLLIIDDSFKSLKSLTLNFIAKFHNLMSVFFYFMLLSALFSLLLSCFYLLSRPTLKYQIHSQQKREYMERIYLKNIV